MESVGPRAYKTLIVQPGKAMFRTAAQSAGSLKNPSPFDQCSFFVNFNDFEWPQALKSGKIQVKIEQNLIKSDADPKDTWAGTLSSGVMTLDLKALNAPSK